MRPLVGAIDVTLMRAANLRVAKGGNGASPEAVARWLGEQAKVK